VKTVLAQAELLIQPVVLAITAPQPLATRAVFSFHRAFPRRNPEAATLTSITTGYPTGAAWRFAVALR